MLHVFILGTVRRKRGKSPIFSTRPCGGLNRRREAGGRLCKTAPQTAAGDGFEAQISLSNLSCFLQSPSPISQLQLSGFLPSSRPLISLSSKEFAGLTPNKGSRSQEHQDPQGWGGKCLKNEVPPGESSLCNHREPCKCGDTENCQGRASGFF